MMKKMFSIRNLFLIINILILIDHFQPIQACRKKSNKLSPNERPTFANLTEKQLKIVKRELLALMGLDNIPKIPKHHMVPSYLMDIYHWFKISNLMLSEESVKENWKAPNIGITTNDLVEIQALQATNSNPYNLPIKHHRVRRKRRATQKPRVKLNGPATGVVCHKPTISWSK